MNGRSRGLLSNGVRCCERRSYRVRSRAFFSHVFAWRRLLRIREVFKERYRDVFFIRQYAW
jgi:hypothetical protein